MYMSAISSLMPVLPPWLPPPHRGRDSRTRPREKDTACVGPSQRLTGRPGRAVRGWRNTPLEAAAVPTAYCGKVSATAFLFTHLRGRLILGNSDVRDGLSSFTVPNLYAPPQHVAAARVAR